MEIFQLLCIQGKGRTEGQKVLTCQKRSLNCKSNFKVHSAVKTIHSTTEGQVEIKSCSYHSDVMSNPSLKVTGSSKPEPCATVTGGLVP